MQEPGVRFGTRESVEIARALVDIGVDMVECEHLRVAKLERGADLDEQNAGVFPVANPQLRSYTF